jgi:peptide deformylase
VPEFYDYVDRAAKVKVRARDREGEAFELEAEGLLAVCIQHEMDHLDGKLFVDYLSELKRERLKKKAAKKAKRSATDAEPARERTSVPVI